MVPEIRFATSSDGTRIAWSKHGKGPPLIRAGTWLTHLQHDWDSIVWHHWLTELGRRFTVIRYDDRGCGLSDRTPSRLGLDAWVADMHAVVEASGFRRVGLFGMSQGAAIAVAYAPATRTGCPSLSAWEATRGEAGFASDRPTTDRKSRPW